MLTFTTERSSRSRTATRSSIGQRRKDSCDEALMVRRAVVGECMHGPGVQQRDGERWRGLSGECMHAQACNREISRDGEISQWRVHACPRRATGPLCVRAFAVLTSVNDRASTSVHSAIKRSCGGSPGVGESARATSPGAPPAVPDVMPSKRQKQRLGCGWRTRSRKAMHCVMSASTP